jgi:hypothetical protein
MLKKGGRGDEYLASGAEDGAGGEVERRVRERGYGGDDGWKGE